MEREMLKINILVIAVSGILMMMAGIILYFFRHSVAGNMRYFLPIPPIAVAAYVFVFKFFEHYKNYPDIQIGNAIWEVFYGTVITAVIFSVFTVLLMLSVQWLRQYL